MRPNCLFRDRRGRWRCTECYALEDQCTCPEPDETAHIRLTSDEGQFLSAVFREAHLAQPVTHLYERIVSEFGMLGMMLITNPSAESSDSEIRAKLVKIAAALTQLATKGTPEYAFPAE